MEANYTPKSAFEGYVLAELNKLQDYHTNHLTHHYRIYRWLGLVAVALVGGIIGLYFKA